MYVCLYIMLAQQCKSLYGVASVSRIDRITVLFCRISSLYRALLQKTLLKSCLFCRISFLDRALLQKILIILSILLTEGTPYSDMVYALYIVYTI